MRNPAAQGRPDANHADVVKWYRELYVSVVDTHELGGGFGDLVVGFSGITDIVEIKTIDGELLPSQVTFHRDWRGRKPVLIRDQQDVIDHVQRVRTQQARIPNGA